MFPIEEFFFAVPEVIFKSGISFVVWNGNRKKPEKFVPYFVRTFQFKVNIVWLMNFYVTQTVSSFNFFFSIYLKNFPMIGSTIICSGFILVLSLIPSKVVHLERAT